MANEIWTIKRCLEWTKEYLAERGEEHPRLSAEWLLCAATGLARIDLYMRPSFVAPKASRYSTSPAARSFA